MWIFNQKMHESVCKNIANLHNFCIIFTIDFHMGKQSPISLVFNWNTAIWVHASSMTSWELCGNMVMLWFQKVHRLIFLRICTSEDCSFYGNPLESEEGRLSQQCKLWPWPQLLWLSSASLLVGSNPHLSFTSLHQLLWLALHGHGAREILLHVLSLISSEWFCLVGSMIVLIFILIGVAFSQKRILWEQN
jgi:hypothetical protein